MEQAGTPGSDGTSRPEGAGQWAGLSVDEALARLGSTREGLTPTEAAARLARDGPNALPRVRRRPWYAELVANFVHLFAILLWAGAALAAAVGMPQLACSIVAVIAVNGIFSFWQEYQAERAAEALAALLPARVTVRRAGQPLLVDATAVVVGDLLLLDEGEAVPADARLLASDRLRLDLSSLTGESRPVPRTTAPWPAAAAHLPGTLLHERGQSLLASRRAMRLVDGTRHRGARRRRSR